jgi:hypothetical protein
MIFAIVLAFVAIYVLALTWTYRRGAVAMLLLSVGCFLVVTFLAFLLGDFFTVPDPRRLVIFLLGFLGPVLAVPTGLLVLLSTNREASFGPLPIAAVGAGVGLALGYLLIVFGFLRG